MTMRPSARVPALGVPVSIDNDSNLAALGEHAWGAGQDCTDCVTIKFHNGIGCGLFVNGTLGPRRRGRHG
jgi:predicted NBD/HSP70 family sugar kinase